jgi:protein-S-isoprenylcysteine O-methyltransferase
VVIFVAGTIVFLLRIPVEERYMLQLFPDQYPEYKKRTKALIPFVW